MSVHDLLVNINREDKLVALAVERSIPQIERLVEAVGDRMLAGGRLFYIGAGTSGRLGVVDASECPPTFGVPYGLVNGVIAGGAGAITQAAEFAEDNRGGGWEDLLALNIASGDSVIGIAASGTTPYVIGALDACRREGILTGCITNNPGSPIVGAAEFPVEVTVGPEFVTGSTRMKSGTAQKLVLNMISTSVMIRLGRVSDNRMVDMKLSNDKLVDRGTRMVMDQLPGVTYERARELLLQYGSVRKAVTEGAR
jgi:N-acetylmuramic acid 6-phosphate etherase